MQLATILSLLSAATLGAAAPTLSTRNDPTLCAPGTGFFQSCSNGFRGCCAADACTIGYCPGTVTPPSKGDTPVQQPPTNTLAPGTCAPGTGNWYVCASGFTGCCTQDACTLGYCPSTKPAEPEKPWNHEEEEQKKPQTLPEGQCAPGTGFYQVCGNGFKGCCTKDACSLGYCPPAALPRAAAPVEALKRDDTVCAPGTGFFQSCGNGFRGCCAADACSLGYCPTTATKPTEPTKPTEWEHKEEKPATELPAGQCAPGTGYYQVCSNGFKGCCTKDACGLGYCPLY